MSERPQGESAVTIELNLRPDLQTRVQAQAAAFGLPVAAWLEKVIEQAAPPQNHGSRTLDLFAAWDAEDVTSDPDELERRQRECEEFQANLNRNRAGERPLYPGAESFCWTRARWA